MSPKLVKLKADTKLLVYLAVVSLFVDLVSAETEYERKSRYKDCGLYVTTAGCPNPAETEMLRCMNAILSCPEGEQYHCTRQKENPTYYIDGCAKSKWCLDGEAPYLKFKDEYGRPSTNLHIVCDWCHNENFFNSADRTNSSTYFECKKKVRCDFKYGFECHIEYPDVFKHNRKCGCNTSADAIFRNDNIDLKNASQVDSHFCTSVSISNVVECIYSPCSAGYERSKNQSCVKKPLPSSSHPTYKPTESLNNDSSVSTSQRVSQSSTPVRSTVTVSTTQKQPQAPTVAENSSDNTDSIIGGTIGAICVLVIVCIVLAVCLCRRKKTKKTKEPEHVTIKTYNNIDGDYYDIKNNRRVQIGSQGARNSPHGKKTDEDNSELEDLLDKTSQRNDSQCSVNIEGPDKVGYSKNLHTQTTNNETPEAGADRRDEAPTTSQSNGQLFPPEPNMNFKSMDDSSDTQPDEISEIGESLKTDGSAEINGNEASDLETFKMRDTQPDEISEIGESLKTDGSAEINGNEASDLETFKMQNTNLKPLKILDVLKKKKDNFEAFHEEAVRIDTECEEYKFLCRNIKQKHDVKINGDQIESPSVFCPDGYQRLNSTGDGNCLFNSVSLLLFGTEEFSSFLRLHTAMIAAQNWKCYIKQCEFLSSKWNLSVMKYLEMDGLTPDETEKETDKETDEERIADAVKRLIMKVANNNQDMNPYLHMQFLSDAIKRKIFQYFEDSNIASHVMETQNPAKIYDEVVPCLVEDICDTPIHILWVNMSGNTNGGLNHIVPLVKMS